jgi:F420H(2)-dependent quinone reductase
MSDWNAKAIAEFRANEGRVGGIFEGAPMVLLHHRGRKSGREYVTPTMYLPHETEPDVIYVFATKGGVPTNPGLVLQPDRGRRRQCRARNRDVQGDRRRSNRR